MNSKSSINSSGRARALLRQGQKVQAHLAHYIAQCEAQNRLVGNELCNRALEIKQTLHFAQATLRIADKNKTASQEVCNEFEAALSAIMARANKLEGFDMSSD